MSCEGCGIREDLRDFDGEVMLCPDCWIDPQESAIMNAAFSEFMERKMMGYHARKQAKRLLIRWLTVTGIIVFFGWVFVELRILTR